MVAGKQQSHGTGKRKTAVRAVGGKTLIAAVGSHLAGQVLRVGKRVQAQVIVTDTHPLCRKVDVLQGDVVFRHQQSLPVVCADYLIRTEPAQSDKAAVVHDTGELFCCLQKLFRCFPVQFLRDDVPPAQRAEVALHPVAFPGRFRQVQVAGVAQIGSLVEMTLEAAREEAHVLLLQFRSVRLTDEPVLLVDDGEVRQHLDGLAPAPVYRLVLRTRDRVKLRQFDFVGDRQVGIL